MNPARKKQLFVLDNAGKMDAAEAAADLKKLMNTPLVQVLLFARVMSSNKSPEL